MDRSTWAPTYAAQRNETMVAQTEQARVSVYQQSDASPVSDGPPARDEISSHHLTDETRLVGGLIERAIYTDDERRRTAAIARRLIETSRNPNSKSASGIDAFMREYDLSTEEGVILLCLAEALLRIPDQETADAFLADKLAGGNWRSHLGASDSLFVNASTWGLMLSGRVMKLKRRVGEDPMAAMARLVARSGEGVVRAAVRRAMAVLSEQFVMGRDIDAAIARVKRFAAQGYRVSYDMLGEEAVCARDAAVYFDRYLSAIEAIGEDAGPFTLPFADALMARPSVSLKLSALHEKFTPGHDDQVREELVPKITELVRAARAFGLAVTFDAEEQDRLDLTLEVFGQVFADPELAHWNGLGLAVQAYSKRAIPVLRWLRKLALFHGKRMPVRLVKGAYWDNEIKWAQQQGLADYPVFTRKIHTDVSYLACMRFLLSDPSVFYPQFATHNGTNIAAAMTAAGNTEFEFQRLHGMGEEIFTSVLGSEKTGYPCRIYAPVGAHDVLLSYLVRRLLENGANTSFVNRVADREAPISEMVADPVERLEKEREAQTPVKLLVRPRDVFWPDRKNSTGLSFADPQTRKSLTEKIEAALAEEFEIGPLIVESNAVNRDARLKSWMLCPHDRDQRLGSVEAASAQDVDSALANADRAASDWNQRGGTERSNCLLLAADLFERDRVQLMAALIREAGLTIGAAQQDVRRAIDFLRFYAAEGRELCADAVDMRTTTGETSRHRLVGRGVFAVLSPFCTPVSILTGQLAAALVAGNSVVAKPAPQAPLCAYLCAQLLHEAGVPSDVLQVLPGPDRIGAALCKDERVAGVAFSGRHETARTVRKVLAERQGPTVPLIAATSTQNAVLCDSSALAEQVVKDVVTSTFENAGQSCAAVRVVFVQDDTADRIIGMLAGAIEALTMGDPISFATDIGPVIDGAAQDDLDAHKMNMKHRGHEHVDLARTADLRFGHYVAPALYELKSLDDLKGEVFGPILHVVRFSRGRLDQVVRQLASQGFHSAIAVYSRIDTVADYVAAEANFGNVTVNRPIAAGVAGSVPFGGVGQSGNGVQAGGPNYVRQFARDFTRTDNITATGGNVRLLAHDLSQPD